MSEPTNINAVNAWYDDENEAVILALRPKGEGVREHEEGFLEFRLPVAQADFVVSQLHLLTRGKL